MPAVPDVTHLLLRWREGDQERLEAAYPRQAHAVTLYYLGGLTQQEVAEATGVSQPTVVRDLRFAQAWLAHAYKGDLTHFGRTGA